ncbi:extracellular solute-binding protein [Caloramator sp. CAR-1]|uniref:extracellular solute-binding protein n=1 Tax=Caloramator sp. CAR-1 TaxID=3062777 RepID=UPI0026E1BD0B|nr:extracellular solute-binding protein [Caloramator sp. CAR-1]MDO6356027.1 extracellular solute-binding protein [Caloramator sp. CAR-1]
MLKFKKSLLLCLITIIALVLQIKYVYAEEIVENKYSTVLKDWQDRGLMDVDGVISITPSTFILSNGAEVIKKEKAFGYYKDVIHIKENNEVEFEFNVPKEGLYNISLDYYVLNNGLLPSECSVKINGVYQFYEARRIVFPQLWKSKTENFSIDRFKNEVVPQQEKIFRWNNFYFEDAAHVEPYPLKFYFKKGINKISIKLNIGEVLIGDVKIKSPEKIVNYQNYFEGISNKSEGNDLLIKIQAEKPSYKNDTSINPITSRDYEVVPYDTNRLLLNVFGGETWKKGGQTVYYEFEIPKDGLYKIAFKYSQPLKANSKVFRNISIDGNILYEELRHYGFDYSTKWKTEILGDSEGDYKVYLKKGKHVLGLQADKSIYSQLIYTLNDSINQINDLALKIRKLVGNDSDKYIDWEIKDYFPNIDEDLMNMAQGLEEQYQYAINLNGGVKNSQGLISLKSAIDLLKQLSKDPDRIPKKLNVLNEGTGSIVKELTTALEDFENQPLILDEIYIFNGNQKLPNYNVSYFKRVIEGLKRFINSFKPQEENRSENLVLNVWVNRSRNYIDVMQRMADEDFTPKTGIKVNFSLMRDEQKLILANASGTAPDVALGVSNWIPFEMGIRGAALDLKQFKDFESHSKQFSPGAFISLMAEGKCFGLPETQDFYVLFYRKDILENLNIPVPNTWQDVINILPELQRYGMNFYLPIGGSSSFKSFMTTAPFIFQYNGNLYNKDGLSTAIDSKESLKGIKLMTDLFTIYGLPMQVPNFFEHFRDGTLPIGISNFTTYVQLNVAAPELKSSWDIAPSPGIIDENGNIVRWQTGSAQSCLIFNTTKHPNEAWEFLKWWTSDKVQSRFATEIQTMFGDEYMWNTANLNAFNDMPIPREHKEVILQQWKWLREVPKTPAGYIVEREISNVWNKVVLEGKNLRASVDEAVIKINKEIARKMEEFGYIKDGKKIKEYKIPTIDEVRAWGND